jgi:hypothetical protein
VQGNHYGGTFGTFRAVVWSIMSNTHKTSGLLSGPTFHSDYGRLAALGLSL